MARKVYGRGFGQLKIMWITIAFHEVAMPLLWSYYEVSIQLAGINGPVSYLHTPQVPLSFAQCLQYLQFLQALQFLAPVQVADFTGTLAENKVAEMATNSKVMVIFFIFAFYYITL